MHARKPRHFTQSLAPQLTFWVFYLSGRTLAHLSRRNDTPACVEERLRIRFKCSVTERSLFKMQVQLLHVIVVGTFLSYLMPGLLVIIVVPDRQSSGFIWTVSIYFVVATFLYLGTLLRIFYKKKNRFQQPLYPEESKNNSTFVDCPPSYAEVTETPPPYYLLPKSIQRSSSRLRKEYALQEQKYQKEPQGSFLPSSSSRTFKRIVFRSHSLITRSPTSNYWSFESPSESMFPSSSVYSSGDKAPDVESCQFSPRVDETSPSSSRKSSGDSLSSLNQVGSSRKLSLVLRNTLSCPTSSSST